MPDSTGVSATSGKPLSNWGHVEQSIRKILTTPKGSRVMRRTFGSDLLDLIDAKMTRRTILAVYAAAATAILEWEPRYRMSASRVTRADADGSITLEIFGTYYPRGHRGDYSISESASVRVIYGGA
ncbi:GPW/gp25 family protein [Rhizobium rhizogenes]|uniref:GPW/gp25 family protein n=1 Tax=Rhizobium rhizogenes TaxID=359 RepID=UPI0015747443|nr:GPW/gp25 family protein [Rhizobium rhizogenes]NTF92587.1 baseplate assembly protein [Rhizobium rhizogenes]